MNDHILAENLAIVRQRIIQACTRAGRDVGSVELVAVSKTHPAELVWEAMQYGQRCFGENRVEEALPKFEQVATLAHDSGVAAPIVDLIGHLQSRKAKDAVGQFRLIHSVDSLKLAQRLSRIAVEQGVRQAILLEVNVAGEASKEGFRPDELEAQMGEILACAGIQVQGLMTVASIAEHQEAVRPIFRRLRELRDRLAAAHPQVDLHHLSMGMTDDFEVAIGEGATLVRVGRAIFGQREVK